MRVEAQEMCLGIPMQIQKIDGSAARAGLGGTTRLIYLDILDEEVEVGDFVIVHAGFAIHKIDEGEAQETLDLFEKAGLFSDAEVERGHGVH
jgi:hydrogenase expression/formation protein HypC